MILLTLLHPATALALVEDRVVKFLGDLAEDGILRDTNPQGQKTLTQAHYYNSPNNKFNPDPTRTVHYGNMMWEEMDTGFFAVTAASLAEVRHGPVDLGDLSGAGRGK